MVLKSKVVDMGHEGKFVSIEEGMKISKKLIIENPNLLKRLAEEEEIKQENSLTSNNIEPIRISIHYPTITSDEFGRSESFQTNTKEDKIEVIAT